MRRVALLLALLTCVVASFSYIGAVATDAFFIFVIAATVLGGACALVLGRPGQLIPVLVSLLPVGAWSVAVNALSGDASGPVARSAAIAGIASLIAVHGARRGRSDVFVAGLIGIIVGAMFYGSAGEVGSVIGVTSLVAFASILALSSARHGLTISRWRFGAFVVALFLLLGFGVMWLTATLPGLLGEREPVAAASIADQTTDYEPPWSNFSPPVRPDVAELATSDTPPTEATTNTASAEEVTRWVSIIVGLLLVVIIVLSIIRITWVSWCLSRWRRRLANLPARESIAGSWAWLIFMLRRWNWGITDAFTVESAPRWAENLAWPGTVRDDVATLANFVRAATFERTEPGDADVATSWRVSVRLVDSCRRRTPRWRRVAELFEAVDS